MRLVLEGSFLPLSRRWAYRICCARAAGGVLCCGKINECIAVQPTLQAHNLCAAPRSLVGQFLT